MGRICSQHPPVLGHWAIPLWMPVWVFPPLFPEEESQVDIPSAWHFVQRCRQTWRKVRHALLQTSQRYQRQANHCRRTAPKFRAGQRVWLATKNLPLRVESRTLSQKYIGPFWIARKVNPVSYRLFLPRSLRIQIWIISAERLPIHYWSQVLDWTERATLFR